MYLLSFAWKDFFLTLYARVFDGHIFDRGAQVAFYFSFSLFPLLFFLISVFGLVLGTTDTLKSELFGYLSRIMPPSAFHLVVDTVEEIIASSTKGKLTLGILITLWSASAGVDSLRNALNEIYELRETRPWWKTKLQSLVLTFLAIALIGMALGIVFYGWQLVSFALDSIGIRAASPFLLGVAQWVTILLVMLLACEVIFNLVPNFRKFKWIWITPGSIVAIILWILFTGGFRTYLEYFNTYNRAYGSLGAVIILMLWLYLTAVAVLLGGAINAIYYEIKYASRHPEPTPDEIGP